MRGLLEDSYARLRAGRKGAANAAEVALAGFWRIRQTERIIAACLERAVEEWDEDFWSEAWDDEVSHVQAYWDDLVDLLGPHAGRLTAVYRPCPASMELVRWAMRGNLDAACYRVYLEYFAATLPEAEAEGWRSLLPRTAEIHLGADPWHSEQCFQYLTRFRFDAAEKITFIEACLLREMAHQGIPKAA